MFEVGFTEIVLIVGLALLVLGPEKLPGLLNKVGRWTGRARSMARQLRTQLEHEVTLEELAKSHPLQTGSATTAAPPPEPIYPPMDEIQQPTDDMDPGFVPSADPRGTTEQSRPDLTKPPQ